MKKLYPVAIVLSLIAASERAAAQEFVRAHGEWNVYTLMQDGKKTCYIASAPTGKSGTYKSRGEPYALVTHRSADVDEVSVSSGYPYKEKSEAKLNVDKKEYKLFTKDELAWAYDEKQDSTIVKAMKKGSKMVVKGSSQKGTTSADTYSLKGFSKAYDEMKKQCSE